MDMYDGDLDHTVPELRYDVSGYSGYPNADHPGLEMRYHSDYDWSGLNVDPNRQLYPIGETLDPQCQAYLGYPGIGQQQQQQQQMQQHQDVMTVGGIPYLQTTADVSYTSPLRQLGYGGSESLYTPSQTFSSVSPTGSSSSTGSGDSSSSTTPGLKPKRKRVQSAPQRKAANIRERRRMFHLNEAFDELRKRLPAFNYEKRLSRIETLRLAMTYIGFMKDVSDGQDPEEVKLLAIKTSDDEEEEEEETLSHKENVIISNEI